MADAYDPVAAAARSKIANAIYSRRLIRPTTCEKCGCTCFPDAHHDDYSRPMDVRWLCRSCHKRHHLAIRRANGSYTKPGVKVVAASAQAA